MHQAAHRHFVYLDSHKAQPVGFAKLDKDPLSQAGMIILASN